MASKFNANNLIRKDYLQLAISFLLIISGFMVNASAESFAGFGLIFVGALVIMLRGANSLVDGAAALARHYGISPILIALTIVAFGTSVPELTVNVISMLQGNTGLALGNIVGSNISNTALILGFAAILAPLAVKLSTIEKEGKIMVVSTMLFLILCFGILPYENGLMLTRIDGFILVVVFFLFLRYLISKARKQRKEIGKQMIEPGMKKIPVWEDLTLIAIGIIFVVFGGKLFVDSGVGIATLAGISETLVGLSIVAFGTSFPELVTSAVAALKKEYAISVGNIFGSNMFNLLLIGGISAMIAPIPVERSIFLIYTPLLLLLCLFAVLFASSKEVISRREGAILFLLYFGYVALLILNPMAQ